MNPLYNTPKNNKKTSQLSSQYDPEAIKKIYNPKEIIAKEKAKQNTKRQSTFQQQNQILTKQKNPYQSFVTGPESSV